MADDQDRPMTDARAMPWSEAQWPKAKALLQALTLGSQSGEQQALDLAIALGDRCAQAEQERPRRFHMAVTEVAELPPAVTETTSTTGSNGMSWQQRAEQAEQERDALREALTLSSSEAENRLRRRAEQAEAETARLREELAHWKVCMNCGEPLAGPGICSQAVSEHEKGLELMVQEALDRAEQAETRVQALEAQIAALTQERDALRTELLERDDMREGV